MKGAGMALLAALSLLAAAAHADYPACKAECAASFPDCAPYLMELSPNGCSSKANRCIAACRAQFLPQVPGAGADVEEPPETPIDTWWLAWAATALAVVLGLGAAWWLARRRPARSEWDAPPPATAGDIGPDRRREVADARAWAGVCGYDDLLAESPAGGASPELLAAYRRARASFDRIAQRSSAAAVLGWPGEAASGEGQDLSWTACADFLACIRRDGTLDELALARAAGAQQPRRMLADALAATRRADHDGVIALAACLSDDGVLGQLRRRRSDRALFLVPPRLRSLVFVARQVDAVWHGAAEFPLARLVERLPEGFFSGPDGPRRAELAESAAALRARIAAEANDPDNAPVSASILEACLAVAASAPLDDANARDLAELAITALPRFYAADPAPFRDAHPLAAYLGADATLTGEADALVRLYDRALDRVAARTPRADPSTIAAAMPQVWRELARRRYELALLEDAAERRRSSPRPGALAAVAVELVSAALQLGLGDEFRRHVGELDAQLRRLSRRKGKPPAAVVEATALIERIAACAQACADGALATRLAHRTPPNARVEASAETVPSS